MSAAFPVLMALLLMAFAGILLQRYSPAFALLLSLGAAVWLLLRLAQPLRGVLQAMVQLGQRTNAQAFSCLLRSAGILLLADYVRTLCEEAGADTLAWCAGWRDGVSCWRRCGRCWNRYSRRFGGWWDEKTRPYHLHGNTEHPVQQNRSESCGGRDNAVADLS